MVSYQLSSLFNKNKTLRLLVVLVMVGLLTSCGLFKITPADDKALLASSYSDVESLQLAVGDAAPDFSLIDADGQSHTLNQYAQKQTVLLLFYRGDWCPFCINQLDSINSVLGELARKGVQVIAVSPDKTASVNNTRRRFGQNYLFLSDSQLAATKLYGIQRNEKLPHPAVFVIKQGGQIAWLYASENYKQRPTGEQLLDVVNALN